ncbi:MAG: hypothetical protein GXY51_02695 [Bacteroidetes bacterium]|jgi:5-methylcytosine-specific restriction endonuclease McrA|nr:hypothetical protein [Bacteroidota bacterium]
MNLYQKTINRKIKRDKEFREGRRKAMIGENNPRWNGGTSQYPNHADFKRARIEVLKRTKGKCEICGEPAMIVHHIDGNKNNHELNNLLAVCRKCHEPLHNTDGEENTIKGRPTKYKLIYGKDIKELANIFGVTKATIYGWINNPQKRKWLEEQLNKNKIKTDSLPKR